MKSLPKNDNTLCNSLPDPHTTSLCFYLPSIQCHSWWNGNQSHLLSGSIRNRCRVRLLKTRSSLCSAKGSPWRPTHLGIEIENKNGQKMDSTRNWKLLKFANFFPSPWPFSIFSMPFHKLFIKILVWHWRSLTSGHGLKPRSNRKDLFSGKKMMNTATKNDRNYWSNLVFLDGALMKFACIRMASPNHHAAPTFEKSPHSES